MQERPRDIIDGLLIMKHALRARHCIIAIEDNKKVALTLLKNSLQEHEAEFLKIVSIPTIYPSGGEKQLIRILTGKEVPSHGLPIDIGVVCHNVATAAAICKVINEGKPLVERYITVTGETLDQPRNLKVRIGTPCIDLLNACGWREDQTDEVLMGGPMMGFGIPALDMPTVKTSNCLLARPKDQPHQQPAMPCIRCGQCAAVCPAQLLPQQMYWYARARDFDKIQAYNLFDCIECGCCAYVCPSRIPLVQYYRFAKTEIWAKERDKEKADHARQRHEFRLQRLERKKKEDEERRRRKKELLKKTQPKSDSEADIKQAAIQAAMDRVKAKRATQEQQKKNIENLNEKQQQAIEAVEKRRQRLRNAGADNEENP
jgi:electron transport complex protein RnfC